jgi:hypothetical protein
MRNRKLEGPFVTLHSQTSTPTGTHRSGSHEVTRLCIEGLPYVIGLQLQGHCWGGGVDDLVMAFSATTTVGGLGGGVSRWDDEIGLQIHNLTSQQRRRRRLSNLEMVKHLTGDSQLKLWSEGLDRRRLLNMSGGN